MQTVFDISPFETIAASLNFAVRGAKPLQDELLGSHWRGEIVS